MATSAWLYSGVLTVQVGKLDADGTPLTGSGNVVVLAGEQIFSYTKTRNNTTIGAIDQPCFTRPEKTVYQGTDAVALSVCDSIDSETMSLFGVYDRVISGSDTVGVMELTEDASCICETAETASGVYAIFWHCLEDCKGQPALGAGDERLYGVTVFPRLRDFTFDATTINRFQDGPAGLTLNATAATNPNFGQGPGDIFPDAAGLLSTWARFETTVAPLAECQDCSTSVAGFGSIVEYPPLT